MQWDTAAYYSFSTIAQTLAGGLGLLAAFVIIRTTTLSQALRAYADQHYREVGARNEHTQAYFAGDLPKLLELYRIAQDESKTKNPGGWPNMNDRQLAVLGHAQSAIDARGSLLRHVARVLYLSVGVIALAIASLPLTPTLVQRPTVLCALLGLQVVGAIVSLVWYVFIVTTTLRE